MSRAIAVLISDVHFNQANLLLAEAAMMQAINKADDLWVPLIVAGDLHDTKANLRAECVEVMLSVLQRCHISPYVIRGNHDSHNEKSRKSALYFLKDVANVIEEPEMLYLYGQHKTHLIPYYHDADELRAYLKTIPKGATLIMHQGIVGANLGDYIQDKSAINPEDVAGMRVISGHYHARQTISLPEDGKWDYIGSPYTQSWGEANDDTKGFQILMDNGSLEHVPTNLRKHIVLNMNPQDFDCYLHTGKRPSSEDLLWIKLTATREEPQNWSRTKIGRFFNNQDFRLDLIPLDTISQVSSIKNLTKGALLDNLIDTLSNTSDERKARLKDKWKGLV